MRHGISLLPDCRPDHRSATEYYRDVLAISRLADQAGLDYVKMTEHYLTDYGGYCPSPLTFLAAVAAQTSRIRLMTGAVLPVFHHPIQLAAHVAQVDAISGGRLDVGFGRAWLPHEFEALGVPIDESRDRYEQTIEAVRRLWTEEKVTEDTPFFAYRDATSLPAPVQQPHPPLWGAAVRTPETFTWLAQHGMGVMLALPPLALHAGLRRPLIDAYLTTFQETSGGHPGPRIALSLPLFVAETDEKAFTEIEPYYHQYLTVWAEAAGQWGTTASTAYPGYSDIAKGARYLPSFDVRSGATAVIGSPETVIEKIQRYREEYAVDTFLWNVDYGGQGYEQMAGSLRLFAERVLPNL